MQKIKTEKQKEKDKAYAKKYYYENIEVVKARGRAWKNNNPEKARESSKKSNIKWQEKNPEKAKEIRQKNGKIWREKNPEKEKLSKDKWKINNAEHIRNHKKEREFNDTIFKLKRRISTLLRNSLSANSFKKNTKTAQIIGCTIIEFKKYLESKFELWMSWENYGKCNNTLNYGWDMDHITPLSSANSQEEAILLNHYTNFQPLCSHINRNIKKNRTDYVKQS